MRYKDCFRKLLILMLAAAMMLTGASAVYAITDTEEAFGANNRQPQIPADVELSLPEPSDELNGDPDATETVNESKTIPGSSTDGSGLTLADSTSADFTADEIVHAADIDEYIDATSPADDPDPIFGTGRIKVRGILDSLEGASEGVSYDGCTLLSYDTAKEARAAYDILADKYGEENVIVDLPLFSVEAKGWGTEYMNLDAEMMRQKKKAADLDTTGKSTGDNSSGNNASNNRKVTVAVIDSGIDTSHEMFADKEISSYSRSFIADTEEDMANIEDENFEVIKGVFYGSHGTEVAGIIAESTPGNVELMILKTYKDGKNISTETVGQAIRYAAENGADVINLSMAANMKDAIQEISDEILENALGDIEKQIKSAANQGIIICAASGNDGKSIDSLNSYPAISTYTLAIGSVDRLGNISSFSNYGSKVDFCAPGESIIIAKGRFYLEEMYKQNGQSYSAADIESFYDIDSGTSLATPYIAACCAYVKMDDPDADILSAKEALRKISIDYGDAGWDQYYGWGMPRFEDFSQQDQSGSKDAEKTSDADKDKTAAETKAKKVTTVTVNVKTVNAAAINKAVRKAGGSNRYVTKIILGMKVRKISKGAFKKCAQVKALELRTKKLKKTTVKKALMGSKITTIKVNVGSKKINKKYVKTYRKIFTKKIAGRKVKVK